MAARLSKCCTSSATAALQASSWVGSQFGKDHLELMLTQGIQINGPAIYPNALPPNITLSSSPGFLIFAVSRAQCSKLKYFDFL